MRPRSQMRTSPDSFYTVETVLERVAVGFLLGFARETRLSQRGVKPFRALHNLFV